MCIFCEGEVVTDEKESEVKCDKVTHVTLRFNHYFKHTLNIINCPNLESITYFPAFLTYSSLHIIDSKLPGTLNTTCDSVFIQNCYQNEGFNIIKPLNFIVFKFMEILPDVHKFMINTLCISNCPHKDLSNYILPESLESVSVRNCDNLKFLPCKVFGNISVSNCKSLQVLPGDLSDAAYLDIVDCRSLIATSEFINYSEGCPWIDYTEDYDWKDSAENYHSNIKKLKVLQRLIRRRALKRRCVRRYYLKQNGCYLDLIKLIESVE